MLEKTTKYYRIHFEIIKASRVPKVSEVCSSKRAQYAAKSGTESNDRALCRDEMIASAGQVENRTHHNFRDQDHIQNAGKVRSICGGRGFSLVSQPCTKIRRTGAQTAPRGRQPGSLANILLSVWALFFLANAIVNRAFSILLLEYPQDLLLDHVLWG